MINVEFSNKAIRFKTLKAGDVFTVPPFNTLVMKTENVCLKENSVTEYNAITLEDGFLRLYDDNCEVIPRIATIVVDR